MPSSGDPPQTSEIQSLTRDINSLTGSVNRWNKWYLIFLSLSIIVGVATVFSQYKTIRRSRDLSDTGARLDSARERQLSEALKAKDVEIEKAKASAGGANERAAKLEVEAAQLKVEAEKSRKDIAEAQRGAAEASVKAEGFRLDIAKANERAASANEIAERERLARLQLEARLADRTLTEDQQNRLIETLSSFSETVVDAVFWGDTSEVKHIGTLIIGCLEKAGWKVNVESAIAGGGFVSGILIGIRPNSDPRTTGAGNLLIRALQSNGIASGLWDFDKLPFPGASVFGGTSVLTHNAPVKLFIGSKP